MNSSGREGKGLKVGRIRGRRKGGKREGKGGRCGGGEEEKR